MTEEQRQKNLEACRKYYRNNKEKAKAKNEAWPRNNLAAHMLNQMRRRAKDAGYPCTMTKEDLETLLVPMVCAVTGLPLVWKGSDRSNPWSPSPDKIDRANGYVLGNVRITCWLYNWARGTWSDEDLLKLAKALIDKENTNG